MIPPVFTKSINAALDDAIKQMEQREKAVRTGGRYEDFLSKVEHSRKLFEETVGCARDGMIVNCGGLPHYPNFGRGSFEAILTKVVFNCLDKKLGADNPYDTFTTRSNYLDTPFGHSGKNLLKLKFLNQSKYIRLSRQTFRYARIPEGYALRAFELSNLSNAFEIDGDTEREVFRAMGDYAKKHGISLLFNAEELKYIGPFNITLRMILEFTMGIDLKNELDVFRVESRVIREELSEGSELFRCLNLFREKVDVDLPDFYLLSQSVEKGKIKYRRCEVRKVGDNLYNVFDPVSRKNPFEGTEYSYNGFVRREGLLNEEYVKGYSFTYKARGAFQFLLNYGGVYVIGRGLYNNAIFARMKKIFAVEINLVSLVDLIGEKAYSILNNVPLVSGFNAFERINDLVFYENDTVRINKRGVRDFIDNYIGFVIEKTPEVGNVARKRFSHIIE